MILEKASRPRPASLLSSNSARSIAMKRSSRLPFVAATIAAIAISAVITRSSSGQSPAGAGDSESIENGNPRDVAAAKEALGGWWSEALKTRNQRLAWWREARFGCFIHWGVYSGPAGEWNGKNAGGYAEHLMRHAKIPLAEYREKVVSVFNPEQFNANEWVHLIKGAGMKYVVITAKHHDGFAMWPSDVNKYNLRDATKFPRDPMRELSEACRKNGIRFGFYYSHAFDWEDPNAPGNDWDYQNPGGDRKLFGGTEWYNLHPEVLERVRRYVDGKAIPELQELVTKYHPDIFWFDTPSKLPFSEQLRIVEAVRKASPEVVINGRAARGLGRNFGDYLDTSDRPAELRPTAGDWECIPTTNESYGYHKLDHSHKPVAYFIHLLAMAAAKGGNMLLNIGPMGNGQIAPEDQAILRGIGEWMAVNGESIRGTERTPLERQAWGESTRKGNAIYLHIFDWPSDGRLIVGGLQADIRSAYLLSDPHNSPLKVERLGDYDTLVRVPDQAPDKTDSVVVLQTAGEMKIHPGRLLADKGTANRLLAFDAEARGNGFKYGDGKAGAYFVAGFKKPTDSLAWKTRLNEPATFSVSVKYSTATDQLSGSYQVKLGEKTFDCQVKPTRNAKDIQTVKLGSVKLPAGEMEILFQPLQVAAGDALQLFEIDVDPANSGEITPKTDVQTNDAPKTPSKPEPKRIKQSLDGSIVLPARDVVVHGTTVRYEPDKNTIGYWLKKEDWVSWELEVVTPGTFNLEMLEGCGAGSGGSHYTVEIADQKLQDKVQDTGSFHDFRLRKVGEVKIDKPGNYTLSVRVDDKPGHAVMDLRLVALTPPKPKKENSAKPESPK